MNCEHARLLIGADPFAKSPELVTHLESCDACRQFQTEMVALEADIRRALEQPAAVGGNHAGREAAAGVARSVAVAPAAAREVPTAAPRRAKRWREWALAATVVVATIIVGWVIRPTESLAHAVVAHVNAESDSWDNTKPVDAHALADVLNRAGVSLNVTSDQVMYARTCFFRGHWVPHLIIQTTGGPVTVMVLPDEHVRNRMSFYEGGLAGIIAPSQHGSVALLAQSTADIEGVAREMSLQARKPVPSSTP